ncbi:MAG: glycosyltransferase [Vulcanimicrobiota bacterium]
MKVAYLSFGSPVMAIGYVRKMVRQMTVWRELGAEAEFIALACAKGTLKDVPVREVPSLIAPPQGRSWWAHLLYYSLRSLSARALRQTLRESEPDLVYLRQSLWWPGMLWALQDFPFVVEMNSNDVEEARHRGGLRSSLHLLTREWLLRGARGLVRVTDEIGEVLPAEIPSITITNGAHIDPLAFRPPPNNPRPRLIFAGSPNQPWHGLEKVRRLATLLPEAEFHVYGEPCPGPANIINHGFVPHQQLAEAYAGADAGIGSLALELNGMRQACPLKVREYLAHGLPVMASYEDPDLSGASYYLDLQLESVSSDALAERARAFLASWNGRPLPGEDVRRRVDDRAKESARLDFFAQVAGSRS